MGNKQRISLIIPTLNGELWLEELLSAIVHQTLVPDEILVVDSGSSDGTLALVHRYMKTHSFIRLYRIEKEAFDHGGTRTMA
ncbi:MAG: glycosyltransferase, partial [Candidatus Electrothrix sp. AUS1_2]|nr:glycosyltransferase [Candidatus Electrothrix sp. AUS1_2]